MSRYARGADFERRVKKDLEVHGYLAVRSAGSHGAVDIMAVGPDSILLIQCKLKGVISPADRAELVALAEKYDAEAVLCLRESGAICYRVYSKPTAEWEPWTLTSLLATSS